MSKKRTVINTDELFSDLKTFMEQIGCTNVQITELNGREIEELRKNAREAT